MGTGGSDRWAQASEYERFIGRWSRVVAREFLLWLDLSWRQRWLDVGCGTGALSSTLLGRAQAEAVVGIDRSATYAQAARRNVTDPRARFLVGDAAALPLASETFGVAVSALVLNFVPDPVRAVAEMARVTAPGGMVAVYVWDYAGRMDLLRTFWDAAVALDPEARSRDEGVRFPLCQPDALRETFVAAGLVGVECRPIDVPAVFSDFDDFWTPFQFGDAPAPGYLMSLDPARREAMREAVRERVPQGTDGSITLNLRAWAARGERLSA